MSKAATIAGQQLAKAGFRLQACYVFSQDVLAKKVAPAGSLKIEGGVLVACPPIMDGLSTSVPRSLSRQLRLRCRIVLNAYFAMGHSPGGSVGGGGR